MKREAELGGRWPIVSNVISILVDGFPMWVSCARASGCLRSDMIYSQLLGRSMCARVLTHTHGLGGREGGRRRAEAQQRVI